MAASAPATLRITTQLCNLCDDQITVTCGLADQGTKASEQQPNAEGGTLDAAYSFEVLDPEPLYAHYREKHGIEVPR